MLHFLAHTHTHTLSHSLSLSIYIYIYIYIVCVCVCVCECVCVCVCVCVSVCRSSFIIFHTFKFHPSRAFPHYFFILSPSVPLLFLLSLNFHFSINLFFLVSFYFFSFFFLPLERAPFKIYFRFGLFETVRNCICFLLRWKMSLVNSKREERENQSESESEGEKTVVFVEICRNLLWKLVDRQGI